MKPLRTSPRVTRCAGAMAAAALAAAGLYASQTGIGIPSGPRTPLEPTTQGAVVPSRQPERPLTIASFLEHFTAATRITPVQLGETAFFPGTMNEGGGACDILVTASGDAGHLPRLRARHRRTSARALRLPAVFARRRAASPVDAR